MRVNNLQKVHGASTLVDVRALLSVDCGFTRQAKRALPDCFAMKLFHTATACKHSTDRCRSDFKMKRFICAGVREW